MRIIAVIPAYNEATRIAPVVKGARAHADEVIVVDDHSRDNVSEVAKKAGARVVRLAANCGAGFATRVGCDLAVQRGADCIVTLDADGQHDPSEIPALVQAIKQRKLDIVFGSRRRNQTMPMFKRVGNALLSTACSLLFSIRMYDSQTGYHVFTVEAYKKLRWESHRYGVVTEFVVNTALNRLKYAEYQVKTIYTDKVGGMGVFDAMHSIWLMLKWRFTK